MKMQTETGVMRLQAKEHQGLLHHQKLGGRHGPDSPSEVPEETSGADTLISGLYLPDLEIASKNVREYITSVLSHQYVVTGHNSPRRPIEHMLQAFTAQQLCQPSGLRDSGRM